MDVDAREVTGQSKCIKPNQARAAKTPVLEIIVSANRTFVTPCPV